MERLNSIDKAILQITRKICERWDVSEEDKLLFFRYSLADGSDAKNYYDSLVASANETAMTLRWKTICNVFASRSAPITKRTVISNRLDAIKLEDARKDE